MPIQAPQWTDYLNCPACCREFSPRRSPISLSCGHTLCRPCLKNLIRKQCPFDQSVISMDLEELVVNTALLQLMGYDPPAQPTHPSSIQSLSEQDRRAYDVIVKSLEQLAVFLKYCCTASANMIGSRLSRPMQRKLVTLLQCSLMDEEGRGKAARAARSLGERTVSELILQHQNPQQLSVNLWAAVRSRGCQFLGPAMQEEVLKLVLLALEDGSPLSRKVLVMFVVQRLEPHFPQASKTSIGHVVQLLYRASCFKVSKRESDSSLMQLKEEFRTYESLRREHDAQIVQIATESGLRIAPDQWSALLYGDTLHKSHMQSIIDKLQTPHSFAQSVQELFFALQRTGDPAQLLVMSISLDRLTNIDPAPAAKSPNWQELAQIMSALKDVVSELVDHMKHQRDANHNLKTDRLMDPTSQPSIASLPPGWYKVAICRDAQSRTFCPRGNNCTFAHTEEELEMYNRPDVPPVPPTPASRMVPPPGPINYPPPNIRIPMQHVSPPGRQHGMGAERDVPDEYSRRRQSFERHQFDHPPPPIHPSNSWSYANALVYGPSNSQHRTNLNGGESPVVPSQMIPSVGMSPVVGAQRQPALKTSAFSPRGGGMRHPGGGLCPMGGGGITPVGDGSSPMVGLIRHPNGCVSPMGGVYPNEGAHQLNERMAHHNPGFSPISPADGAIVELNDGIGFLNTTIQYGKGFTPIGPAIGHINNASLPPSHKPPDDSRYFPRQRSEKLSAYSQGQNDSVQMGGMTYRGMRAEPESELPEFIPRKYRVPGDLLSVDDFGLGPDTKSRFESAWQPMPVEDAPQQKFTFNETVKNLPEGIHRTDTLPMGINITDMKRKPQMDYEDIEPSYPQAMYYQPNPEQHLVPPMPGPSDNVQREEAGNQNVYSLTETKAVLDTLHTLAVKVTSECSDNESE